MKIIKYLTKYERQTFRKITPIWFSRITNPRKNTRYNDLDDYSHCIAGEAYLYRDSYASLGGCRTCHILAQQMKLQQWKHSRSVWLAALKLFLKHFNENHR